VLAYAVLLLQYLCLFLSAGQPGQLKKVQASVTAARKVFRIMRVSSSSKGQEDVLRSQHVQVLVRQWLLFCEACWGFAGHTDAMQLLVQPEVLSRH
jgi:hypothetical protein